MSALVTIDPEKRLMLSGLFSEHKHGRVLINAVLEGRWGIALADDEFKPQAAVLLHNPVASTVPVPSSVVHVMAMLWHQGDL